ncbi:MAG: hypothetical protein AAF600_02010 [Bacteroidota bacterium]
MRWGTSLDEKACCWWEWLDSHIGYTDESALAFPGNSGCVDIFTNEAIGPFELSEVVIASLVIRKLLLELKEGEALVFFLHDFDR